MSVTITRSDRNRLQDLLRSQYYDPAGERRSHFAKLSKVLTRAHTVAPQMILPTIVTMNSTFTLLDVDRQQTETYTLVYPHEACDAEGKLSVLSPLGSQLLGRRVGKDFTIRVLDQEIRKRVERIWFQPERLQVFTL